MWGRGEGSAGGAMWRGGRCKELPARETSGKICYVETSSKKFLPRMVLKKRGVGNGVGGCRGRLDRAETGLESAKMRCDWSSSKTHSENETVSSECVFEENHTFDGRGRSCCRNSILLLKLHSCQERRQESCSRLVLLFLPNFFRNRWIFFTRRRT